ncbi:hypothetical protein LJC74_05755 [Eubacteriales bacterium OttesenSCG-928-A19]|nr:hypothetical protein [Eubacteriales bacterium OttesenSCG-928-A19]
MQVKKITAKIRDMVMVSLMESGDERHRYYNIELPDAIKELEMKEFDFHISADGKIDFQITFDQGILPKVFPEPKARKKRGEKATTPAPAVAEDTKAAAPAPETKPAVPVPAPIPATAAPEMKAIAKVEDKPAAPAMKPAPVVKPTAAPKPEAKPEAKTAPTTRFPNIPAKAGAAPVAPADKPAPKAEKKANAAK